MPGAEMPLMNSTGSPVPDSRTRTRTAGDATSTQRSRTSSPFASAIRRSVARNLASTPTGANLTPSAAIRRLASHDSRPRPLRTADLLAECRNIGELGRVRASTHYAAVDTVGTPGRRVASVSDEPSNTASEAMRAAFAFFEYGPPPEEAVRALLTDDFVYQDRRSGVNFEDADADSFPKYVQTPWNTGATARPRFELETLAVRG